MREKFRQFMIGRYGTDGLNQFLSMSSIVMLLVSLLTRVSLFTWLGAALLILCYYRSLSRNISKRTEENYRFYSLKDRFNNKFRSLKEQWANRKLYPALADSATYARIKQTEIGYRSHRFPIIKTSRVAKAAKTFLRTGDIIALCTGKKGLDVSHMGILFIDEKTYPTCFTHHPKPAK